MADLTVERELYRGLWGRAGFQHACPLHGAVHHRSDSTGAPVCMPCVEASLAQLADAEQRRCTVCNSAEHDACGYCGRCKEHTTFTRAADGLYSECCGHGGRCYDDGD